MADITFALVRTGENAKSAWISGDQVFKYTSGGSVSPAQITLTANLQNVSMVKWQYRNSSGVWTDYPTTADNANITGTALNIKPAHAIWVGIRDAAHRHLDANVGDTTSIYKVPTAHGWYGAAGQKRPGCSSHEKHYLRGQRVWQVGGGYSQPQIRRQQRHHESHAHGWDKNLRRPRV